MVLTLSGIRSSVSPESLAKHHSPILERVRQGDAREAFEGIEAAVRQDADAGRNDNVAAPALAAGECQPADLRERGGQIHMFERTAVAEGPAADGREPLGQHKLLKRSAVKKRLMSDALNRFWDVHALQRGAAVEKAARNLRHSLRQDTFPQRRAVPNAGKFLHGGRDRELGQTFAA